jgi:predicted RecB family endonuclease
MSSPPASLAKSISETSLARTESLTTLTLLLKEMNARAALQESMIKDLHERVARLERRAFLAQRPRSTRRRRKHLDAMVKLSIPTPPPSPDSDYEPPPEMEY